MTQEAQCILIAEACGYSFQKCLNGLIEWRNPDGGYLGRFSHPGFCPSVVPKYTTDLNAMHQAEKVLTAEQWHEYDRLMPLRDPQKIHATAAQRAEAFLRTLNLWRDDA